MHRPAALTLTIAGLTVTALAVPWTAVAAPPTSAPAAVSGAAVSGATVSGAKGGAGSDELPNPLETKRRALRQEALTQVLNGEATPFRRGSSTVVKVAQPQAPESVDRRGRTQQQASRAPQYVELSREATDRVFVVLTEFGDQRDPRFPDKDLEPGIPGPTTFDGPLHNQIPAPDRSVDNSTVWQADYSPAYYRKLYFGQGSADGSGGRTESVRQYYEKQSSGRYSIDGVVTNWVKVPYNEARYGRSSDDPSNGDDPNVCSGHVCSNSYDLVRDGANQWYADQIAAGRAKADVDAELRSFDVYDRYDVDGDGNFDEPDGYIDHFQILHAGGDEADGDPIQGEDAIWSHRAFVYQGDAGSTGPSEGKQGGTQIGDSGVWVGDYTMQPENGGMSVISHEYGHDLGLPDLYDTAGPAASEENSVGHWSLMSQNRVDAPGSQELGTRAADLGAWEKLQLGWLDYETVGVDQSRRIALGPHEFNSRRAQGVVKVLPKKEVTTELGDPYAGDQQWYSGTGDDYTASMSRSVTLPAGAASLSFQARYNIEADYDYAYVEVDDGSGWVSVPGTGTDPAVNNGLTGDSGGQWVPLTFDLSAFAGKTVDLRVRYTTDGGVQGNDPSLPAGLFVDALTLTAGGAVVLEDGAETSPNGWTLDGFSAVGSSATNDYDNYYIASYRSYTSFDRYLQSGPYYFGYLSTRPDYLDRYPYQDGLLVSYWDTSQSDNNASVHPGEGLILPVDAHPQARARLDGGLWRPRVAAYDATFGPQRADSFTLHQDGVRTYLRGLPGVPVFDDARSYWDAEQPTASVQVPDTGTRIRVLRQGRTTMDLVVSQR